MAPMIRRRAVRAILLTPEARVLLMRIAVQGRCFWIAPGGGIQARETAAQALHRELSEELGLEPRPLGPLLRRREHQTTLYGQRWCQYEEFFLIPITRFQPRMRDRIEAKSLREFRWWHLDELADTAEQVTPTGLHRIVTDYLRDGPPSTAPGIEQIIDPE
ncbi:NUDIX domain-containing protein [Paracoccus sp. DMF-8]|uniref:NUDIX domain-containing protein n=1 Tax=Paracoccus sp. DMF-8 TaxID=3019445 RepID=UPI0023E766EC|nr:NUDIX domain-containing protein [Paracoccus sp. DMF-8]MDF3606969.1 NUDIX domain-containing protein [Paracoccus sp. DMF-8]